MLSLLFLYFIIYVQIEYFSAFSFSKAIIAALGDGFYYDFFLSVAWVE